MKLKTVTIKNYKSVFELSFDITEISDKSYTFGLIGVNEAGKSSILKALSLKDDPSLLGQKDFNDKNIPVEISYFYELNEKETTEILEILQQPDPHNSYTKESFKVLILSVLFEVTSPSTPNFKIKIDGVTEGLTPETEQSVKQKILDLSHKAIFWTADPKYLITQPINITEFANSPETISIPLKNCFHLAGITDIKKRIDSLIGDSTEIEQLQNELGNSVTSHIKKAWKNHPIKITFLINDGFINFHIKDDKVDGRAKTTEQRSDGFKQFISFLLTVSAQNINGELANSILLLDEPETHLHPKAQEYLLDELKKISTNEKNNIAFFATHSNYMVDKDNLDRNYRISKYKDKTNKTRLDKLTSTYASVNFEVFEIPNTDYHNELYSKVHLKYQDEDSTDSTREQIKKFDFEYLQKNNLLPKYPWKGIKNQVTLPTYIRNCIHHSDNGDKYTSDDLVLSINKLKSLL